MGIAHWGEGGARQRAVMKGRGVGTELYTTLGHWGVGGGGGRGSVMSQPQVFCLRAAPDSDIT